LEGVAARQTASPGRRNSQEFLTVVEEFIGLVGYECLGLAHQSGVGDLLCVEELLEEDPERRILRVDERP
jgi:hypothetical protein